MCRINVKVCVKIFWIILPRLTCWLKIRTTCGPRRGSDKVELLYFSLSTSLLFTIHIKSGWTYGLNEDSERRRSPHLLPYVYVDEAIKVANRNTASETVRTLLVYGYVLDPPTGDVEAAEVAVSRHPTHRTYRAENTYGVSSGKWWDLSKSDS